METKTKKYSNTQELAVEMLKEKEIKFNTAYITSPELYDNNWLYLRRVAANDSDYTKRKFTLIEPGEHVKNCIKITWNPDRYTKSEIKTLVQYMYKIIQLYSNGTCQTTINIRNLVYIFSGVIDRKNKITEEARKRYEE